MNIGLFDAERCAHTVDLRTEQADVFYVIYLRVVLGISYSKSSAKVKDLCGISALLLHISYEFKHYISGITETFNIEKL